MFSLSLSSIYKQDVLSSGTDFLRVDGVPVSAGERGRGQQQQQGQDQDKGLLSWFNSLIVLCMTGHGRNWQFWLQASQSPGEGEKGGEQQQQQWCSHWPPVRGLVGVTVLVGDFHPHDIPLSAVMCWAVVVCSCVCRVCT